MSDTNAPIDEIHARSLQARAWIREQVRVAHMKVAQWDIAPLPEVIEAEVVSLPQPEPERTIHGRRNHWWRARG